MRVNNCTSHWVGIVLLGCTGCIEPFSPQLKSDPAEVCVVAGEITSMEGYQTVTISKASSVVQPMYLPLSDCKVFIEDDKGNTFAMDEYKPGLYRVWIGKDDLNPGTSYRLRLIIPEGDEIRSDYDVMAGGPEIDTIYYLREKHVNIKTGALLEGIQFYGSFSGRETDSRLYHWSIEETYEYHTPYAVEYYYDGSHHAVSPPDYSLKVCWKTQSEPKVFNVSTKILARNGIAGMALHYVDNTTTRLYDEYSVLVGLHALSEPAYVYWEKLRANNLLQEGSLYEHQPLPVEGNLHNITHPENKVLGFFGAASLSQKRIFVHGIHDLGIEYDSICGPDILGRGGWKQFTRADYPVYYKYFKDIGLRILDANCVDCRKYGGTITKPDFWPY